MPSPLRSRRSGRAWISAALTLGLLGGLLAGTGATGAAAETETEGDASAPSLTIAPTEPVLDETEDGYGFAAQVDNPGETAFAGGRLRLEIAPQPLDGEEALDEPFPERGVLVSEAEVGETATASAQTVSVTVRRDELPLAEAKPGVYRVRATLTPERSDRRQTITPLSAETTVVWKGVGEARTRLTTIVPIVLPTELRSMPSRKQLDEAAPRFDTLLDAATAARATLAIDPRIISAIRGYGDEAPLQARRFLERLESSQLPSFLLQFADADPAAQAALGYPKLLQPVNLDYITAQGSFPSENIDGVETEPVPPSLEELLAWPQQDESVAWPADGQVDRATLDLLQSNGISETVLDSSNVTHSGGPRAALGDGQRALVSDAALGDAVRTALSDANETVRQAGFAEATARLALAGQSGTPGRVLALDRGAVADSDNTAAIVERLFSYDWVVATPAADQQEGTASLRAAAPLEERREQLRSAAGREADVVEVGAVLEHPEQLAGYQRARLLDLFATHYAEPDSGFEAAARQFSKRDEELRLGVRALSTGSTQLVGASTQVPVQLHNSLPFDALVDVRADPSSAALSVSKRGFPRVVVPAEGNSRVLVPVRSRVSSGESGLSIKITDTSGSHIAYVGTLTLTIRSGFETIALSVLGVAAALLLVFGTLRSIRGRRTAAAANTGAAPDVDPAAAE